MLIVLDRTHLFHLVSHLVDPMIFKPENIYFQTNTEDHDGYTYKFKLNRNIKINGPVRLEQFIFQNSQYVFSEQKKVTCS
jgi:hypothetical protein